MIIAVGLGWLVRLLVVAAFLEAVVGFPDKQHVIENQSEAKIIDIRGLEDIADGANRGDGDANPRSPRNVCHYGPTQLPYPADTLLEILPESCQKVYCDETGTIQHIFPLGPSVDCCVCHNRLYGRRSNTCQYLAENGRCQAGCALDGITFGNGEVVESVPLQCTKKRCNDGEIVDEPIFGGMAGCCLDADDQMRENGYVINDGCLEKICTGGIWKLNTTRINAACKKCSARNDPHFIDFSGVAFDWHVGCNHALVQEDKLDPTFGVFMDFNLRGSIAYIGGPTTYQEDMNTHVVLTPGTFTVSVNGLQNQVDNDTPTLLVGPNGETTVYAWKFTAYAWRTPCIMLYGKHMILVELCGSSFSIWAAPWSLGDMMLGGLCGSTKASALAAQKLVARDGTEYSPSGGRFESWSPDAPPSFGLSWQAEEQTKDTCPEVETRSKMMKVSNNEDIRKACLDDTTDSDKEDCLKVVDNAGLIGDDRDNLYYNCLFDLCISVNDPGAPFTREEMLEQIREIADQIKSHVENTIEFAYERVICPFGWSPVGGQCYQIHTFGSGLSLEDAQNNCKADKATLAYPKIDITEFNKFTKGSYWLGFIRLEGAKEWIVGGGQIPKDQYLIGVPRENVKEPNNCLEIQLPTTASNKLPYVIVKQNVVINAKKVKSVKVESLVYYYNGDNELIRTEGTNSTMECVKPEVYVCERDPIACGDNDDDCAWRAADGECEASKAHMYNTCKESCNVPCECDQPPTCTEVGGMCQPLNGVCNHTTDRSLCPGGDCTCCYIPDPCQDSGDEDCEQHKLDGLCELKDEDVIAELKKHCSRTCGLCDPLF